MPRFYFNVQDGVNLTDLEGTELKDVDEARSHAVRYAGEMMFGTPEAFCDDAEWTMEVTDEQGLILFTLILLTLKSPATLHLGARAQDS